MPPSWSAAWTRGGVDLLPDLSEATAEELCRRIEAARRPGDLVLLSIHWGDNWGYDVPGDHVRFAHRLIEGGADIVHGHSSHHPRPIEVYRNRLILYGCGDFLNDYEGIGGYEEYRGNLALMYCPTLDRASGTLADLRMVPFRMHALRLSHALADERSWMASRLDEICRPYGSRVERDAERSLRLRWT